MKIQNVIPSRPQHLVVIFADGERARLDIAMWLDRNSGVGSMLLQGRFDGEAMEWPLGERLYIADIRQMLDQQSAVIS